jgi:hypothetical protein
MRSRGGCRDVRAAEPRGQKTRIQIYGAVRLVRAASGVPRGRLIKVVGLSPDEYGPVGPLARQSYWAAIHWAIGGQCSFRLLAPINNPIWQNRGTSRTWRAVYQVGRAARCHPVVWRSSRNDCCVDVRTNVRGDTQKPRSPGDWGTWETGAAHAGGRN